MVISNLNTARILDIIGFIEGCIEELRPFSEMKEEEFLSDRKNPPFVESYLRRGLEAIFDIGRHILAKTAGFKEIEYKSIAMEMGKKGIITKELSEVLYRMAGYRNRMVHFYREVTAGELYQLITSHLSDFERFNREVTAFLRAYEKEPKNKL